MLFALAAISIGSGCGDKSQSADTSTAGAGGAAAPTKVTAPPPADPKIAAEIAKYQQQADASKAKAPGK